MWSVLVLLSTSSSSLSPVQANQRLHGSHPTCLESSASRLSCDHPLAFSRALSSASLFLSITLKDFGLVWAKKVVPFSQAKFTLQILPLMLFYWSFWNKMPQHRKLRQKKSVSSQFQGQGVTKVRFSGYPDTSASKWPSHVCPCVIFLLSVHIHGIYLGVEVFSFYQDIALIFYYLSIYAFIWRLFQDRISL